MIGFIDKKIAQFLKRVMHKKRSKIIAKTLADYQREHDADENTLAALNEKLELEATRIIAIVDESIIEERIKRARYTFWVTAIVGTAVVVAVAAFPITTSIAPFFAPLIAAGVAWAVSIATIPISYNKRVKGAMDSAVLMFEIDRAKSDNNEEEEEPVNIAELQNTVRALQAELVQMRSEIKHHNKSRPHSLWRAKPDPDNDPPSPAATLRRMSI